MLKIKKFVKNIIKGVFAAADLPDLRPEINNNQIGQRQLFFHYQYLKNQKLALPRFSDTGFRVFSQADEDGLLLYIFSLIGFTNKFCLDIAFASPYGANTTNLICNWGFSGLLIDGKDMKTIQAFFNNHKDTAIYQYACYYPPTCVSAWVTAENVNDLCIKNGIKGEIDLFSLDMDGNDYWIWKNLTVIKPRVVIAEALTFWGKKKSVTVPYRPQFNRFDVHPDYMGASQAALVKLAKQKGYRLVGSNQLGYNLIFVRNDLGKNVLPKISLDQLPTELPDKQKERLNPIKKLKWIKV